MDFKAYYHRGSFAVAVKSAAKRARTLAGRGRRTPPFVGRVIGESKRQPLEKACHRAKYLALGFTVFMNQVTANAKPDPGGGSGGGAIAKAELGSTVQQIESLNPYQNRWTIEARITSKGA